MAAFGTPTFGLTPGVGDARRSGSTVVLPLEPGEGAVGAVIAPGLDGDSAEGAPVAGPLGVAAPPGPLPDEPPLVPPEPPELPPLPPPPPDWASVGGAAETHNVMRIATIANTGRNEDMRELLHPGNASLGALFLSVNRPAYPEPRGDRPTSF